MDKCTFCAGGPEPDHSEAEFSKYGRNRISEGKLPVCAEQCGTKALLGGDANIIAGIYRQRVQTRGYGPHLWGWDIAYEEKPGASNGSSNGPANASPAGRRDNLIEGDTQNAPGRLPT
jgi:formate dehydrogenase iron-sulfur subunit